MQTLRWMFFCAVRVAFKNLAEEKVISEKKKQKKNNDPFKLNLRVDLFFRQTIWLLCYQI